MRVEEVRDRSNWTAFLNQMNGHDFAHTFDFHQIARNAGEGEPIAFVALSDDDQPMGFWPVLKRGIEGADAFDLTSVYGYAGPLVADSDDAPGALPAIETRMAQVGAVSLFSRMHPLFADRLPPQHRGVALGDVVLLETNEDPDTMRGYRGSHRREIVNAAKAGLEVVQETGSQAIAAFHDIYSAAMTDLSAADYYFFDLDYLRSMADSRDFRTIIFFATFEGEKIAASMFTLTGDIMQYYLSGGLKAHRKLAPSKAIIAEAHRQAASLGARRVLLGGGLGSREDALYSFKQGFSSITAPFSVTRRVFDQASYAALCDARGVSSDAGGYFPAYRAPAS